MQEHKVLFICTANSCRSQMAEAWGRSLFPGHWRVCSAGLLTYPIGDRTRQTMREVGLDLTKHKSKLLDTFDLDEFDLVVTLSEEAGRFLPGLAEPHRHLHSPVTDPMGSSGTEAEIMQIYRDVRGQLRDLVSNIASGEIPLSADSKA